MLTLYLGTVTEQTAQGKAQEEVVAQIPWEGDAVMLRLHVHEGGTVTCGYLLPDGTEQFFSGSFLAEKYTWSGAKPALFARNVNNRPGGKGHFAYAHFIN